MLVGYYEFLYETNIFKYRKQKVKYSNSEKKTCDKLARRGLTFKKASKTDLDILDGRPEQGVNKVIQKERKVVNLSQFLFFLV